MPTIEPRTVLRDNTKSNIGKSNVPGGNPTSDAVPRFRSMPMAWSNAVPVHRGDQDAVSAAGFTSGRLRASYERFDQTNIVRSETVHA